LRGANKRGAADGQTKAYEAGSRKRAHGLIPLCDYLLYTFYSEPALVKNAFEFIQQTLLFLLLILGLGIWIGRRILDRDCRQLAIRP
jgi:hypothetical protein